MKLPRACISIPTSSRLRHAGGAKRIDWSRDGRYLATVSFDKRMGLWDAATGEPVHFFGISDCFIEAIAFSPDSTKLASGKKGVNVIDLATRKKLCALKGHRDTVHDIHFSPDSTRIATASSDKTVRIWDLTGAEIARFTDREATAVRFSPDGRSLLIGRDGTLTLCSAADGSVKASASIGGWNGKMRADFCPDGSIVVAGHDSRAVLFLAADTLEETGRAEVDHWLRSVAASPCGRWVAYCGGGRQGSHPHRIPGRSIHSPHVYIWDREKGALHARLTGHVELMQDVVFSPDGSQVASCSSDNTIRTWALPSGEPLLTPGPGFEEDNTHLTWRSDTELLVSGRTDGHRWNARTGEHLGTLPIRRWSLPLSGDRVAGLGWTDSGVWSLSDPDTPLRTLDETGGGEKGAVYIGVLLPDQTLIAGGESRWLKQWNLETGAVLRRWKLPFKGATSLALSPDGKTIAIASINDSGRLWLLSLEEEAPTLLATLPSSRGAATCLEALWTPDGSALLVATNDSRVWRVPRAGTPTVLAEDLTGKQSWGYSGYATLNMSLSPDGKWLAVSFPFSGETCFYILSATDGHLARKVTGHKRSVHGLAFSPDGTMLASMDVDFRTVMVWDVPKLKLK